MTKKTTASKKTGLGRGIDALLPDSFLAPEATTVAGSTAYQECAIETIRPNRFQPRRHFNSEELTQLSDSIREQGVLQPLLVRRDADGFELVAGERRLRAARMAGLARLPIVVKAVSDQQMLEISIVENIQRDDLNPMEEADAYHRLTTEFGLTQEQIARRVGKKRTTVSNLIRLRQLPGEIKTHLLERRISMGHARALLAATDATMQQTVLTRILEQGISVRQTEALINTLIANADATPAPIDPDTDYFRKLSAKWSDKIGKKVQIKRRGKHGAITIGFDSKDELERLLERLQG